MAVEELTDFAAFSAAAKKFGVHDDLKPLLALPVLFFQRSNDYTLIALRDYRVENNRLVYLSKEHCLVYGEQPALPKDLSKYKSLIKRPYGESTIVALILLRRVLESYQTRFEEINKAIDETEETLDLYRAQDVWKKLRRTTDRVEDFVNLILRIKDREVLEVDTNLVSYDYDVLNSSAQHLLDRCRSHLIQLSNLRNEFEVAATLTLSRNVEHLTKVTVLLAIVTLIISVPNLIGTFYGMNLGYDFDPAYVWPSIGISLIVSTAAGVYYWKTYRKRHGGLPQTK